MKQKVWNEIFYWVSDAEGGVIWLENSKYNTHNMRKKKCSLGKESPVILIPEECMALAQLLRGEKKVEEIEVNRNECICIKKEKKKKEKNVWLTFFLF